MVAKVKTNFKDIDKGYKKIVKDLGSLDQSFAKVGIMGSETYNNPSESGLSVVDIAVQNEFGTDIIPSRPFMRQTFERHSKELNKIITEQISLIYTSGKDFDKSLNQVASWYKDKTVDTLRNGAYLGLKMSTIKAKGSSRPLIDTGRMWQSITYVVIK